MKMQLVFSIYFLVVGSVLVWAYQCGMNGKNDVLVVQQQPLSIECICVTKDRWIRMRHERQVDTDASRKTGGYGCVTKDRWTYKLTISSWPFPLQLSCLSVFVGLKDELVVTDESGHARTCSDHCNHFISLSRFFSSAQCKRQGQREERRPARLYYIPRNVCYHSSMLHQIHS